MILTIANVVIVGIVFAPTLNIPAPLISLFVTDHAAIFGTPVDIKTRPTLDRNISTISQASSTGSLPPESFRFLPRMKGEEARQAPYATPPLPTSDSYEAQQRSAKRAYDTHYSAMPINSYAPQPQYGSQRFGMSSPAEKFFPHNKAAANGLGPAAGTMSASSSGTLNDVHISNSPFMGGESPEIPRTKTFESPGRLAKRSSAQLLKNVGFMSDRRRNEAPGTPTGGRF